MSDVGPGPNPTGAAPGWYPVDHLSQRYWDGQAWTDNVAPLAGAGAQNAAMSLSDQRTYALIMHLGSGFVGIVVPLVMWLIKKDQSPFIDDHGKNIMNWSISVIIYAIVSFILIFVIIGIFLLLGLVIAHIVFSILGAVAANRGDSYHYPLAIKFIS